METRRICRTVKITRCVYTLADESDREEVADIPGFVNAKGARRHLEQKHRQPVRLVELKWQELYCSARINDFVELCEELGTVDVKQEDYMKID